MDRQTSRHSWASSTKSAAHNVDPLDGRLSPVADVETSSGNEDEVVIMDKQEVRAASCPS